MFAMLAGLVLAFAAGAEASRADLRVPLYFLADRHATAEGVAEAARATVGTESAYVLPGRTLGARVETDLLSIPTGAELSYGNPAREIVRWVAEKGCDLVAMSTHGHQFVADLLFGTTASRVQHSISVPVLLLRAR